MKTVRHLETIIHITPLGIRCVDISTQSLITDGLRITATETNRASKPKPASVTSSGVYALHNLPGLHDFEYQLDTQPGPNPLVTSPPIGKEFAIQLEDLQGRFLPWGVMLTLPRKEIFKAFLFSAPSRSPVPGLAVIRGELKDATRPEVNGRLQPAAHARIEAEYDVTSPPTVYVGLADARGQFALFLPFPNALQAPAGALITSPNTPGRKTLSELRWPVTLSFFYEPDKQKFICTRPDGQIEIVQGQPDGFTDGPRPGWRCVPDLSSLLKDQSAAQIYRPALSPPATNLQTEIEFGKEVVVRAAPSNSSDDTSIWIAP